MRKTKLLLGTTLALGMLTGMTSFQAANAAEYVVKAQAKTLHKAPLQGVEGKEVIVKHFALPAEFVGASICIPALSLCTCLRAS